MVTGFVLRIIFTPWEISFPSPDSLIFFEESYNFSNGNFEQLNRRSLWPAIISFVYIFLKFDNISEYVNTIQIISIFISSITIPIVYIFSKHFIKNKYALFASALFAINPHIISNSTFGLTESLFIFLSITSLYFLLKFNFKEIILGLGFIGLAFDTRLNAIFLPFIFSIILIFKVRPIKEILKILIVGLPILIVIVFPYYVIPNSNFSNQFASFTEYDEFQISPHLYNFDKTIMKQIGISDLSSSNNNLEKITTGDVYWLAFLKAIVHLGKTLLPFLIFMVPFGLYQISKKSNFKKKILWLTMILYFVISIPQYTISAELRNLLFLIPIFCVISAIFLESKIEKIRMNNLILISILTVCIISSVLYLNEEKQDIELILEKESFGKFVAANYEGKMMGDLTQFVKYNLIQTEQIPINYSDKIQIINPFFTITSYDNLEKFMNGNDISYVIIDNSLDNRYPIFQNIFYEENFPKLKKVYDSKNDEFSKLKVKIFKNNFND